MTSSSLLYRWFAPNGPVVRFVCTSYCRPGLSGMSRPNTWLSSKVSPVLIRCAARSTLAGVMWLPEPRSSAAPHFDGQRSLGDGGCQLCAMASALKTERPKTMTMARLFMAFLPFAVLGTECYGDGQTQDLPASNVILLRVMWPSTPAGRQCLA